MEPSRPADGLSPLDHIRLMEGEITRGLIVAREAAEQKAAQARAQAANLLQEARQRGRQAGQIRYREMTAEAEEEAKAILAQAAGRAESMRRAGAGRMDRAVDQALRILLGEARNGAGHES